MSEECKHEWVYENILMLSMPAQQRRICKLCGLREVVYLDDPEVKESYYEIYNKFYKKSVK